MAEKVNSYTYCYDKLVSIILLVASCTWTIDKTVVYDCIKRFEV